MAFSGQAQYLAFQGTSIPNSLNILYSYISNAHGTERFTCMVPSNADPAPAKPIHSSITNPGNQGLGKGK